MIVKPDASEGADEDQPRISTGSEGLDDILGGGLDPNRMYLYEGSPGSGKTTVALQFFSKASGKSNEFSTSPCPRRSRN